MAPDSRSGRPSQETPAHSATTADPIVARDTDVELSYCSKSRSCPSRLLPGERCPFHTARRYPKGFSALDGLVRERPHGAARPHGAPFTEGDVR